jgi:hypothetical protein
LFKFTVLSATVPVPADWWLTTAAASLDLPRRLETCAGERLVEKIFRYSPDLLSC